MTVTAHRGEFLHFLDDPAIAAENAWQHLQDGLMIVENGIIMSLENAEPALASLATDVPVTHYPDALIVPGFIDTHTHFPQCEVIASYGTQLLDWLETHTFPAEAKFNDADYAEQTAGFFLDQLLNNGTTTALVFGTSHKASVEAFFSEAERRNLRMIAGKVLMDRNAPPSVLDTPESGYNDSRELIEKWHGRGRLGYAVTPRFAPTSSPMQLKMAASLLEEFPDVHMQTHLAENEDECRWVNELFPDRKNYLDVYDHHGLLGKRSVFAHSIHLSDNEWNRMAETGSGVSHCPLSNLFIGSGLFPYKSARKHGINVGLGTDVGGGDSFSILRVINEAYKVQQLQGENLSPFQSLFLATLGGANTLDLQDRIGNFREGKEADFVVLDYTATPLIDYRMQHCKSLQERLFVWQMLGDDRAIRETRILGEPATINSV